MRILITGGTGFFGLALLRYWKSLGSDAPKVTILSRNPKSFQSKHPDLARLAQWVQGDVLQPNTLKSVENFTHIIHAAADSTIGPQLTPIDRYRQIVEGTQNVLEFAIDTGTTRFLLASSGGVYGPQPASLAKIPEEYFGMPDPLDFRNSYSVAKRCAEHLCALYRERFGLLTVIARCFAFAGPDLPRNAHFAFGNFIRDALEKPHIVVAGDGSPIRTYMDQRDLAVWLMTILENGQPGEAYNVGSDIEVTISDLAHMVRDLISPQKRILVANQSTEPDFRNRYVPSIEKARRNLGLELRYELRDTIVKSAE
jgi:UDP-glucuronate decarboxylase